MTRFLSLIAVAALALAGCKKDEAAKPAASTSQDPTAGPQRDVPPTARRTAPRRDTPTTPPRTFGDGDRGPGRRMDQFDTDGDGQLSDDEHAAMQADREARRAEREAERAAMKAEFDKDGDGQLSDEERGAMRSARIDDTMTKLDTDSDGKISPDEMAATGGRMQRMLEHGADTDGDGALSRDELEQAMKQRPPDLGNRGGGRWRDRDHAPDGDLPGSAAGTATTP